MFKKRVFSNILHNSIGNTSAEVPFPIKLQAEKVLKI